MSHTGVGQSPPGELQGKCGKVFDPEALASFAAWGLLEFLETVHKPLVQAGVE
jgi:hypothetical protein